MARLTEEEADALDEYYTKNPPKVDIARRGGYFTDRAERSMLSRENVLEVAEPMAAYSAGG
jgi:hypothetical protein